MRGLLGKKKGMTQVFDETGQAIGVTVVETGPCVVKQVKTKEKDGYQAVQIMFAGKKKEILVNNPADYKVDQEIKVDIFKPGENVRVSGYTVGKGFAGLVKRYHARRGPMTHGSKSHRIPGSISSGTTPGRVRPGKKMPGRMGGVWSTVKSLTVIQVLPEKNLLLLKGSVPGKPGNFVIVRES